MPAITNNTYTYDVTLKLNPAMARQYAIHHKQERVQLLQEKKWTQTGFVSF